MPQQWAYIAAFSQAISALFGKLGHFEKSGSFWKLTQMSVTSTSPFLFVPPVSSLGRAALFPLWAYTFAGQTTDFYQHLRSVKKHRAEFSQTSSILFDLLQLFVITYLLYFWTGLHKTNADINMQIKQTQQVQR